MAEEEKRNIPGLIMGTAGHIDHGKTALVRALTGVDLDRLEEEKRRGITIELGFVSLELGDGPRIGVVDVPGHEKFIKTMVAGAHGIDFVLLAIAADEGVMPQTVEHLDICRLLEVRKGLVALTKIDKVDEETLELAIEEVADLVADTFLEGAPVVPCSAVTGEGMDELRRAILDMALSIQPRSTRGIFRMPVDRSFSVKGFGTVVTGTVVSGSVSRGDDVEILPGGKKSAVRDLESHGEKSRSAGPGTRLAINLSGLDRGEVGRGQWVVEKNRIETTRSVDTWVSVLASHKVPLEHAHEIGFHTGTAFVIAEIDLLGRDAIPPGEQGAARLHLKEALPLLAGDRFVLRSFARKMTAAGGKVIDPFPRYRTIHRGRKGKKAGAEFIGNLIDKNTEERIEALVESAALRGADLKRLYLRVPAAPDEIDGAVDRLVDSDKIARSPRKPDFLVFRKDLVGLREELVGKLGEYHKVCPLEVGPGKASFRGVVRKSAPDRVYDMALDMLISAGRVVAEGDKIRLADHKPAAAGSERKTIDAIEKELLGAGVTPPTTSELMEKFGLDKKELVGLLKHMVESGRVRKISENLYYHADVVEKIKGRLREYFRSADDLDPVSFKGLVGASRKFAIPLLEYFDREKFTMRLDNRRVLREDGK